MFWSKPPLYTLSGEAALRVRLKAKSDHIEADGAKNEFWIACGTHRTGLVFEVLEVLAGNFDAPEIAVISSDHYFFDEPEIGETRIVVGRVELNTHVGDQYGDYNVPSLSGGWTDADRLEYERARAQAFLAPSAKMAALAPRAPIELRLLFLFERPGYWLPVGGGMLLLGSGVLIFWLVHRRRSRA